MEDSIFIFSVYMSYELFDLIRVYDEVVEVGELGMESVEDAEGLGGVKFWEFLGVVKGYWDLVVQPCCSEEPH